MPSPGLDYSKYFWQGSKVRLRPLRVEDAEQCVIDSLDTPARQMLQCYVELPTSVAAMREFLTKFVDCKDVNGLIIFAIEALDGRYVGGISWHTRNQRNGTFSFGIDVRAGERGKGYASEAIRILLRYAFFECRYQKCNSTCLATNQSSIALHHKLGFLEEGRRRRQVYLNGECVDEIEFGMTIEEFAAMEDTGAY